MNATNRVVNRVLLLLFALLLAGGGVVALFAGLQPQTARDALASAWRWAEPLVSGWSVALPGRDAIPGGTIAAFLAAVVIVVLLVVFLATRGGGRTETVVREHAEDGGMSIDRNVADAVLAGDLRERPDVLSATTRAYRVRKTPAIVVRITVRRGALLPRVLGAADDAVRRWDALAGDRVPIVIHLAGRDWWDRWRSVIRVRG